MQKKLQTEVSQLLEEVGRLTQQGEREKAYQSSLKATSLAPDEARAVLVAQRWCRGPLADIPEGDAAHRRASAALLRENP